MGVIRLIVTAIDAILIFEENNAQILLSVALFYPSAHHYSVSKADHKESTRVKNQVLKTKQMNTINCFITRTNKNVRQRCQIILQSNGAQALCSETRPT